MCISWTCFSLSVFIVWAAWLFLLLSKNKRRRRSKIKNLHERRIFDLWMVIKILTITMGLSGCHWPVRAGALSLSLSDAMGFAQLTLLTRPRTLNAIVISRSVFRFASFHYVSCLVLRPRLVLIIIQTQLLNASNLRIINTHCDLFHWYLHPFHSVFTRIFCSRRWFEQCNKLSNTAINFRKPKINRMSEENVKCCCQTAVQLM